MALLPYVFEDNLFKHHKLYQWVEPDDLHDWPMILPNRSLRNQFDPGTIITADEDHFQANVDVQQFRPEEISVKMIDDHTVKVEAKHEEQPDGHGLISRHFVRRYLLPKECDSSKLRSQLSSDGILVISAPKKEIDGKEIPIFHTGRPIIRRPHLWPSRRGDKKRRLSAST
ncbi:unnamed protein product [Ceutorhynchus assimilis]|uniref:SHSP domain-containing protein n=1 Tax=Ceutorhynchus assimilis TaxID=467358 RepID=A0A9N9MP69_9CUCU|nr:unnamed protein product [Ceutorhynchus assimilis]